MKTFYCKCETNILSCDGKCETFLSKLWSSMSIDKFNKIYFAAAIKTVDVLYVFPVISCVHNIFFIQFVVDADSTLKTELLFDVLFILSYSEYLSKIFANA